MYFVIQFYLSLAVTVLFIDNECAQPSVPDFTIVYIQPLVSPSWNSSWALYDNTINTQCTQYTVAR